MQQENRWRPRPYIVPYVQLLMMAGAIFLLFRMAQIFGASAAAAAIVSAIAAVPLMELAYIYRFSEALALPLFAVGSYALALWFSGKGGAKTLALAAVALALLALTRFVFIYFVPFVVVAILLIRPKDQYEALRRRASASVIIPVAFALTVAPWYARNAMLFDRPAIGDAGSEGVLALRTKYNQMTLTEAFAGMVYWLPGFGDDLAGKLFSEPVVDRFDANNETSFRAQGWRYLAELSQQVPDDALRKRALYARMLENPYRHAAVSIPMAVRGLSNVWIYLPFALIALAAAVGSRSWWVFGAITLTLVNFVLHTGGTHFIARYGLPMIFGLAPLAAAGLTILSARLRHRYPRLA